MGLGAGSGHRGHPHDHHPPQSSGVVTNPAFQRLVGHRPNEISATRSDEIVGGALFTKVPASGDSVAQGSRQAN